MPPQVTLSCSFPSSFPVVFLTMHCLCSLPISALSFCPWLFPLLNWLLPLSLCTQTFLPLTLWRSLTLEAITDHSEVLKHKDSQPRKMHKYVLRGCSFYFSPFTSLNTQRCPSFSVHDSQLPPSRKLRFPPCIHFFVVWKLNCELGHYQWPPQQSEVTPWRLRWTIGSEARWRRSPLDTRGSQFSRTGWSLLPGVLSRPKVSTMRSPSLDFIIKSQRTPSRWAGRPTPG